MVFRGKRPIRQWMRSEGYAHFLLGFLFLLILIGPLSQEFLFGLQVRRLVVLSLVPMAIAAVATTRLRLLVLVLTAILLVVFGLSGYRNLGTPFLSIAFFGYLVVCVVHDVMTASKVSAGHISYALCAYLLMGVAFSSAYEIVDSQDPVAFDNLHVDEAATAHSAQEAESLVSSRNSRLFYFSIVTLTTLGYGDITPQSPWSQVLAMIEALLGQIFLVVLVARLVAMNIAGARSEPPET